MERKWVQGTLQLDLFLNFFARSEKYYTQNDEKRDMMRRESWKKEKRWNYVFFSKYKSDNSANVKEGMIIVHRRLRHL